MFLGAVLMCVQSSCITTINTTSPNPVYPVIMVRYMATKLFFHFRDPGGGFSDSDGYSEGPYGGILVFLSAVLTCV